MLGRALDAPCVYQVNHYWSVRRSLKLQHRNPEYHLLTDIDCVLLKRCVPNKLGKKRLMAGMGDQHNTIILKVEL